MAAEPLLRQTLKETNSIEMRTRVNALLARVAHATPLDTSPEELRAIQALEHIGSQEAREQPRKVTDEMPGARTTQDARAALQRLSEPRR